MKKLLVATDFSFAATHAARYAAKMAVAIHAGIELLYVYQIPVSYTEIPVTVDIDEYLSDAEGEMSKLKNELAEITGNKISITSRVVIGVFFLELKSLCEEIIPFAVLMGSQGTTAAERLLFGSHTIYAMRHLKWPLITVPPAANFSLVKRIGFACDLEKVEATIPVDELKSLVNDFNAELHILNTGQKEDFDPDIIFETGLLQYTLASLKPVCHFITSKDIDEGIIDFVEKNKIDLLITIPKHHGLINTIIHRSHTKQFILHSHVPVMAIH